MKFKVGDKVKPCNPKILGKLGDVTGSIYRISCHGRFSILWNTDRCYLCGSKPCNKKIKTSTCWKDDIKLVAQKNEQLLFNFMED